MIWTKEPPAVEGYYFWRSPDHSRDDKIAYVYQDHQDVWRVDWWEPDADRHEAVEDFQRRRVEWAGPVVPPE